MAWTWKWEISDRTANRREAEGSGSRLPLLIVAFLMTLGPMVAPGHAQEASPEPPPDEAGVAEDQEQLAIEENLQEILEEPATGETYRYDPQGRRDPFRSLIGPTPKLSRENAPPGIPGFLIEEIDLQGIIRTSQGLVAIVKGPDNIGYTIRAGDKLFDGEVLRVTQEAVAFRQEVNDPTRIERYREVVKELKPGGQGTRR